MEKKRMTGLEWGEFMKDRPTTELNQKLDDILLAVSWREFANVYLGKNAKWIYEKINGYTHEGFQVKPMNEEDMQKFIKGLYDLSERIKNVAESLEQ